MLDGSAPALVAFAGPPGVGKTAVAWALAGRLGGAVYLRVDTVEQALRSCGTLAAVGVEGYAVLYWVAADNLALGRPVIADAVNPARATRAAWRAVAAEAGSALVVVEVVCSDAAEHRRRVEARVAHGTDVPGLVPPTWADVLARAYEPWDASRDGDGPRLVVDTATRDAGACAAEVMAEIAATVAASAQGSPEGGPLVRSEAAA
jgi:predicted kinase